MTIPNFQAGQVLTADGLNSALEDAASQVLSDVQENANEFTEPQTFAGPINQSASAGANNQSPLAQYGDFLSDFIVSGLSIAVPSPASLTATLSTGTAVVLGQPQTTPQLTVG